MKKKITAFLLMLFLTAPSFAKYDDEKFCLMQGYAFENENSHFYAGLLLRILIHRGILGDPKCNNAQNVGKTYGNQLKSAFTEKGFDPSKIAPAASVVIEDFAAFAKRIDTFILKNTGYLD
jgi:hypothetical protein